MKEQARKLKNQLRVYLDAQPRLYAQSLKDDAFHNPIADGVHKKKVAFDKEALACIQASQDSARLFITKDNEAILRQYFTQRQSVDDRLGNLYKTLSFSDFILRLWTKRFKEVYFDGRALVGRHNESFEKESTEFKKRLLQEIGTDRDTENYYKEYLTLEEAVLSPLVLPQTTSIFIGTGNRSKESDWDVRKEFDESIDVATVSYPAAAEFRDGRTTHYDYWFIVRPRILPLSQEYSAQLELIKNNATLMEAAKAIYGPKWAFETTDPEDFMTLSEGRLCKSAYIHRTKNMLKSVLLAADTQMKEHRLGTTFQLKGLGLGAFAFRDSNDNKLLEDLYLQSLEELMTDPNFKLHYIECINLINLPSDFDKAEEVERQAKAAQVNNRALHHIQKEPLELTDVLLTKEPPAVPTASAVAPKKNKALFALIGAIALCAILAAVTIATAALAPVVALPVFAGLAFLSGILYKMRDKRAPESKVIELEEVITPSVSPPPLAIDLTEKKPSVMRRVVDPTKRDTIGAIGGLVVCGDSGSKFGNEGNIGLVRNSSDDPAAQYSLLDPYILDADINPVLKKPECIRILELDGRSAYLEPESVPLDASKTPRL